jgi:hypothetical protein
MVDGLYEAAVVLLISSSGSWIVQLDMHCAATGVLLRKAHLTWWRYRDAPHITLTRHKVRQWRARVVCWADKLEKAR